MPESQPTQIPIHPRIVIRGIETLHFELGKCLEKKFQKELESNLYINYEALRDKVAECLDEVGFFSDKVKEIEQLVEDAKEVLPEDENISIEKFKRDVARNIIEFGDTPEMAYRNAVDDWEDAIGAEELGDVELEEYWDEEEAEDWWDDEDEEEDEDDYPWDSEDDVDPEEYLEEV